MLIPKYMPPPTSPLSKTKSTAEYLANFAFLLSNVDKPLLNWGTEIKIHTSATINGCLAMSTILSTIDFAREINSKIPLYTFNEESISTMKFSGFSDSKSFLETNLISEVLYTMNEGICPTSRQSFKYLETKITLDAVILTKNKRNFISITGLR